MRKKTREQESLELAKIWMKKSIDPMCHGYDHAQKVEENILKIYEEYKQKGLKGLETIDENMILLTVWWHDCFKAQWPNGKIKYYFIEGEKSAKIFEEQNKDYISDERRKLIYHAIWCHNQIWRYRLFHWRKPVLVRLLQEADSIESVNTFRLKKSLKKKRKIFMKFFNVFLYVFIVVYLFFYPMTKSARKIYWENILDRK